MSTEPISATLQPRRAATRNILRLLAAALLVVMLGLIAWCWISPADRSLPGASAPVGPRRNVRWQHAPADADVFKLEELSHADPSLSARLLRFDAMARELAEPTWFHVPYTRHGEKIRAGWSTHIHGDGYIGWRQEWGWAPPGEAHCYSIGPLGYRKSPSSVYGIELNAEYIPAGNGWGARVHYHEGGTSPIYGAAAHATFFRRMQRYGDDIIVDLPLDQIPQVVATPENLRDRAIVEIENRHREFEEHLAADRLQHVEPDMREYRNDGIPPPEIVRPYTPAEKQRLLKERKTHDQQRIQTFRSDYQEMYQALTRAFPLHECW